VCVSVTTLTNLILQKFILRENCFFLVYFIFCLLFHKPKIKAYYLV